MNYNRVLDDNFAELICKNGELRWLYNHVKKEKDLDFLMGKSDSNQWISIYRGLTRLVMIQPRKNGKIKIDGAKKYKSIKPELYGTFSVDDFKSKKTQETWLKDLKGLKDDLNKDPKFDKNYNNKKEGYYQNELSRKFGVEGKKDDDFVILDKEAVVGYLNQKEKEKHYAQLQKRYNEILAYLSKTDSKRFGKKLEKKSFGNELDFIALDKKGNILLIEYKHGTNNSGIFLSPLQIGMYVDMFSDLPQKEFFKVIEEMFEQKKMMGLINSDWEKPKFKKIIPVLIISNYKKSTSKDKFKDVLAISREKLGNNFLKDLKCYKYTSEEGLTKW